MSFLCPDEDESATLAEALALIDACQDDPSASSTPSAVSSESSSGSKRSVRPARAATGSYSTRLQHRKKAEIRALREQVQELQAQVELLHLRGGSNDCEWFRRAVDEFHGRQRAEKLRRQLQDVWSHQAKVNASFRQLLQKRNLLYGRELVLPESEPDAVTVFNAAAPEDDTMNTIAMLEKKVERLYRASDSVFASEPRVPAISSSTQIKRSSDPQGNCVEVVTTTPVSYPLRVAADLLWKKLNVQTQDPERIYRFIRGRKPDSLEKNFVVALHDQSGMLPIDGVQFMRKFEEPDRVVLIKSNTLDLSAKGLHFRDRTWLIVSRSPTDPTRASVARTCYQLYAEGPPDSMASQQDLARTRDFILSSLSGKVRRDHLLLQNFLIEEDRRATTAHSILSRISAAQDHECSQPQHNQRERLLVLARQSDAPPRRVVDAACNIYLENEYLLTRAPEVQEPGDAYSAVARCSLRVSLLTHIDPKLRRYVF